MKKLTKQQKKNAMPDFVRSRIKEVGFIGCCAAALFIIIALVTYNKTDLGWSSATSATHSANAAGAIGAWCADFSLMFFGYMAYIFPLLIIVAGLLVLKADASKMTATRLIWILPLLGLSLVIVSGCGLLDISFNARPNNLPGPSGGIIGYLLAFWLLKKLSVLSCALLLAAVFMIGVTISTGMSWIKFFEFIGRYAIYGAHRLGKYLHGLLTQIRQEAPIRLQEPVLSMKARVPVIKEPKSISLQPEILKMDFNVKKEAANPRTLLRKTANSDKLPDLALLEPAPASDPKRHYSKTALETLSREVEERLLDFDVTVKVVAVCPGPIITRFEMTLAPGVKVSKITGLAKDLARSLSVTSVRVVEVIPGKAVVGLEIPNKYREIVKLRDVLESTQYQEKEEPLTIALGKDISGTPVVVGLDKMPHLLVAGTTGSGKSVGVNAMLLSLLYKATPADLRLILIDPKMLELSIYEGIGHLLTPVVTDMNDAANALRWCVAEMERRYQVMAAVGVRNLAGFNSKVAQASAAGKPLLDPLWDEKTADGPASKLDKLPYIVVIIDEFADMMMVVGKKVEELIARIAQKARAAGIHMILATQRPSVDVITGLIKANVPTRIAFQVSSRIDSRTILDQQGAEQLLGYGDMLYLAPGTGIPVRVHGAFVSDEEVHAVVQALKQNCPTPEYIIDMANSAALAVPGIDATGELGEKDPLYDEAVAIVTETRKASISYLQRRLKIGYNRSARLIEAMESAGVVSEMLTSGVREVLAFDIPRK